MAQEDKVTEILAPYGAVITYVPLKSEVPFLDYLSLPPGATLFEIAPRASLDPIAEAKKAMEIVGTTPTAILMPGRAFDALGTRHGQGGGWYDRFLALVPKEWLRVGICYERQFSSTPLLRQSWDQPMDIVMVVSTEQTRIYEVVKEGGPIQEDRPA